MIALESEGWISIEPHRGAFVHGLDENSVRDHYALVGELYGLAAERATERGDGEGMARLSEAELDLRRAESADEVMHANEAYLRQVFMMARSSRLSSFSRLMTNVVPGNFFAAVPGTAASQKSGISAAHQAIKAGNGARAAAELVALLRDHGDQVVELLKARHILWPAVD